MRDPALPSSARNVFGAPLACCCTSPRTGFHRDVGSHTVCARMTDEFLAFSRRRGNDLVTPRPEFDFPGLKAGDRWCLCVSRWKEAHDAGVAPPVLLAATHEKALDVVTLEQLQAHALRD